MNEFNKKLLTEPNTYETQQNTTLTTRTAPSYLHNPSNNNNHSQSTTKL